MSKSQVKSILKISDQKIGEIPTVTEFGQTRYKKEDVIRTMHRE